jgi:tetratricopeptide (TPR) repeat protein
MANIRAARWLLLVCAPLFIVQSCAGTKSQQAPQTAVQKPVRQKAVQPKPVQAATLARQHMDAGEYQSAIDDYGAAYRSHPQDQELTRSYLKSLEDMKAAADKASNKGNVASAGKIYDMLLKNFASFNGLATKLSFDRAQLDTKLSDCKKSLSAQGFQEYRKGNLSAAIALWQSLLAIDPNNTDIKGALRTATLQQQNLQQRSAGK